MMIRTLNHCAKVLLIIFALKIGSSNSGDICSREWGNEETSAFGIQEYIEIHLETQPHELYTPPGSQFSVPLRVLNTNPMDGYDLIVSYRERFTISKRHVELVHSVLPNQLHVEGNSSSSVVINFQIPKYIISGFRVKVTLILTAISFQAEKIEKAFYFTVSDRALRNFDSSPPICVASLQCPDSCPGGQKKDCDPGSQWASAIYIKDNVTGLAEASVLTEGTNLTKGSFTIGTVKETVIKLITNCCQRGAVIQVKDMAGNIAECIVGVNPNSSKMYLSEYLSTIIFIIFSTLLI